MLYVASLVFFTLSSVKSRAGQFSSTITKVMAKLYIFICAVSFFSHVTARTRENPFFVDYNDDDIVDDLRLQQPDITPIQQLDENVLTIDNQKVISNTNEVECKPHAIPVPISVPNYAIITPRYVTLQRCLGPGYTSVQKCTATKRERVVVKYTELMASFGNNQANHQKHIVMYNDLKCDSVCIKTQKDCDSRTQVFNRDKCSCSCKLNAVYCESINRYFDTSACRCYCKNPIPCPLYQEWNPVTCRCECAQCITNMCKKHHLGIDNNLCKCTADVYAL